MFLLKPEIPCERCKLLTQVIDELSDLLAKADQSRRKARKDAKLLKRLLVMDMEEQHSLSQADGFSDGQVVA